MSSKIQALMKHDKIPLETARKVLGAKKVSYSHIGDLIHHPDLTHEDYSKLRARPDVNKHIDWDLAEIPHLPQKTQLEIINDPLNVDDHSDIKYARWMTELNKNPHNEVLEKAATSSHQYGPSFHVFKNITNNKNASTKALSIMVASMLKNNNGLFDRDNYKSVFDHPSISKNTIQYVHDNSTGEIKDLAKKYL